MLKSNLAALLILFSNFFVIQLLAQINSTLGKYGVFLFVPGLFFFSVSMHLRGARAMLVLFSTGFLLDFQFHTYFGFHPFLLVVFHLIGTMFVQMGKQGERIRPLLFQLIAQILISSLWYFPISMKFDDATNYLKLRFLTDQIISVMVLVPLCLWFHNFVQIILQKTTVIDDGKERIA